jgi:hypothetical protein
MQSLKKFKQSLGDGLDALTLASGAIVYDLVRKEIAVNAEVVLASRALVPTTHTHAFGMILRCRPLVLGGNWWEGQTTRKARRARGTAPGHLHPIYQREQVVVGARKVSRQNQREAARRTLGRQAAHFAPTAGTQIPPSGWLRVACTEGRVGLHGTRGEAHHQERACRLFLGRQWRRHVHQELPEMLLIESDSIGRFIASVGPTA